MADAAIRVQGLKKNFGTLAALDGVDFEVTPATVFGLLGPNGAGKTTAVRVLSTILAPDGGRAEVLGYDVVKQPSDVRLRIGLAGQYAAVDANLTGFENLRMVGRLGQLPRPIIGPRARQLLELVGRLFGLDGAELRTRVGESLERAGLAEVAERRIGGYSGGTRTRCASSSGSPASTRPWTKAFPGRTT